MFRFFDFILLFALVTACLIIAIYKPDALLHFFEIVGGAILKLVNVMLQFIHNSLQADFPKQP